MVMKAVLFLASHAFALKTPEQWAKIKSVVRAEVGREPDDGEIANLLLNDDWAKGCGADFVRLFAADGVGTDNQPKTISDLLAGTITTKDDVKEAPATSGLI